MKELKCPNCQHVFQVDDAVFESIAGQVRNKAFEDELRKRLAELERQHVAEEREREAVRQRQHDSELSKRDLEIMRLNERIASAEAASKARTQAEIARAEQLAAKRLQEKEMLMAEAVREKERELDRLNASLAEARNSTQLEVMKERERQMEAQRIKDQEIMQLRQNAAVTERLHLEQRNNMREQYAKELQAKDEMIAYFKDFKARQSTKAIGESLEQHCSCEFESVRAIAYPTAQFGKDNDVVEGTKGDFIFRDYVDCEEYISIMFEMKNEAEGTEKTHRNEEFFAKLDSDRRKKRCEYAVLVTMLEPDSELYNRGIVDVSHRYEKMFVVRPQFFMPIIGLLTSNARSTIGFRRRINELESSHVNFMNFRAKLEGIQNGIMGNYESAHKHISNSLKQIDSSIKSLTKLKEEMQKWDTFMSRAVTKSEGLTIRKLTHGNPEIRDLIKSAEEAEKSVSKELPESIEDDPLLSFDEL